MSVTMGLFKGSAASLEASASRALFSARSSVSKRGIEIVFLKCEPRKSEDQFAL